MTIDYDPELEHLREIGERNVEVMDLVAKHCSHAKVEFAPFMGRGLAEQMLHLPVNGRTITCPHAARPAGGAMQLEWVAVPFYRQNCVSCPHRSPRGIPNLKTFVEDLDRREAEQRSARDEAALRRAAERGRRRERRHRLVEGEPYTTQEQIAVLDAIDAEEPDDGAGARLLAVVEHAPEIFTRAAVVALVETARATWNPTLLATVRILAHAGQVAPGVAVALALEVLAGAPILEAGHIIVDFHTSVASEALAPALDSLIILSGRVGSYIPGESQADPKPLVAAYQCAPLIVLERIERWLAADEGYRASHGAQAAEAVIGYEPGTAPVLASRLLDRLALVRGGVMRHLDMEGPSAPIVNALTAALRAEPTVVRALIEARALALTADQREALFGAFDGVFRDAVRGSGLGLDTQTGKMVVEFCFARLEEDWGPEVSWRATDTLERVAEGQPKLLAGQALRAWGALLDEACWKEPAASAVADTRPGWERLFAGMDVQRTHDTRLERLRGVLEALVAREPDAVANAAFTILDERDLRDEGVEHMRAEAVRLLGPLGCQPRMLGAVLPHLYTALLGADVRTRALAIDAWAHIKAGGPKHELPAELDDLLPGLLRDTYAYPRQQLVAALHRIGVRDEHLELATLSAFEVGMQAKYSRHIEEAVNVLRWLASRTPDKVLAKRIRLATLKVAERLDDYDLRDFVIQAREELRPYPRYTDLVLRSLVSEPVMSSFADNEEVEIELLWRVPPRFLASRVDGVRRAARAHIPLVPHRAGWCVEALQQAGLFNEAAELAEMIVNEVPTTREYAPRRAYAEAVHAASRFEVAVVRGNAAAAKRHLDEWRIAMEHFAAALAEARSSSDDLKELEQHREARAAAIAALADGDDPLMSAVRLEQAAKLMRDATDPNDDTREGLFLREYAEGLDIGAALHRWDAAVRSAESDADRHLRAAKRRIETISIYREDALFAPLTTALSAFATISEPRAIRPALATFATVPVPTRLLRRRTRRERVPRKVHEREVQPLVVCLFEIDGGIVGHPLVLQLNRVYDLVVRIRVTVWPEWAKALRLEFLSVVPSRDLDISALEVARPAARGPRGVWSLEAKGSVVLRASGAPGAAPWRPRVAVSFIGGERNEAARVVGYTELRLRAFDGTRDQLTGRPSTDERLVAMYSQLWDRGFPEAQVQAFCRFFSAIARAAYGIQADRLFGEGRKITEAVFHDGLERRLRSDLSLGGRVERRTPAGGGYIDLLHDGINAELKVAEGKAATIDGAGKYMGQPTQYGGDLGAQISILCILDREAKRAPVGVLENYVDWFMPPLHGLVDSRYPSRVAVIIVNANLPRPSDWPRRTTLWTKASRSRRRRKP